MPSFSYVAVDATGKQFKGTLEGSSREQISQQIKREGKTPVTINQANALNKDIEISFLEEKPKARDLAVFCRQFVSISSAGVPVTSAFEMLAEQTENKKLAKAIDHCCQSIQAGSTLSESMAHNKDVFGDLFITMVAAGEVSGSLEIAFDRMGSQFEKDAKLTAMMKKASIYPMTILIVAFAVVTLLLAFVIPQFEEMLTDMGTELPWLTVAVINASEFIQSYWYLLLAGGVAAFIGIKTYAKTYPGKKTFGMIQRKMPLFGELTVKTACSRLCRTMSTLIAAGVPLIDTIEIVGDTMQNIYFKESMHTARDDVAMGAPFSETLVRSNLYPPLVCHMTKIGEEVGDMEGMFNKLADYYDEEVETATQSIMAAMEPAIIVILALVVGTIVGAVMMPMADMYSALGNL